MGKFATIFNIQRFSVYDGPGVRTTIFFKGCNLRCLWCHNPESFHLYKELEYHSEKCIGCGNCFQNCVNGVHGLNQNHVHQMVRTNCTHCLKCVSECYAEALVGVGQTVGVDYLIQDLLEDKLYFERSSGGVTLSGGECMLQIEFLEEFLDRCKQNHIHTAVDTAGNVPFDYFERILPNTDLFLYDLKAANGMKHKQLTSVDNLLILENLKKLSDLGENIIVRVPFIPTMNEQEMVGIAEILKDVKLIQVEILGYHRLGEGKHRALGEEQNSLSIIPPTQNQLDEVIDLFKAYKIPVKTN